MTLEFALDCIACDDTPAEAGAIRDIVQALELGKLKYDG
jgi:hypothetical protein